MLKAVWVLMLSVLLVCAGGCAKKPLPNIEPVPVVDIAADPVVVPVVEIDAAPATATLVAQDGSNLETVSFAYDSSTLDAAARLSLQRTSDWLRENAPVAVTIEGHCDERGSGEYNLALGEQRALVVKGYLVNLGIPAERLGTISFGEEVPFDKGHDEVAWSKNRRAAFR